MLERAKRQEERGQAVLAVNDLAMVLLLGWRHQHGADEVLARRARIDLLADVLQQLMHFLVRLDILTLVVWDDVEALTECLLDAVLVVSDASHLLPSSFSKRLLVILLANKFDSRIKQPLKLWRS